MGQIMSKADRDRIRQKAAAKKKSAQKVNEKSQPNKK